MPLAKLREGWYAGAPGHRAWPRPLGGKSWEGGESLSQESRASFPRGSGGPFRLECLFWVTGMSLTLPRVLAQASGTPPPCYPSIFSTALGSLDRDPCRTRTWRPL